MPYREGTRQGEANKSYTTHKLYDCKLKYKIKRNEKSEEERGREGKGN